MIDRVQWWNMAALCGGRVVFVVVLCMTLMGLANCATVAPAAPAATTVAAGNDSVAAPVAPTVAAAPMTVAAGNDSTGVESNTTTVPAIVESNTTTAPAVMVTTAPKTIQEQLDEMSEKLKSSKNLPELFFLSGDSVIHILYNRMVY